MYITYEEYTALGYSSVDAAAFPRFEAMAENKARKAILYRPLIEADDEPGDYNLNDPTYWSEQNKRGICEIIDLEYVAANPNSDAAKAMRTINSFSNGDYSENYGSPRNDSSVMQTENSASLTQSIMGMYYTPAQLYRGIC